MNKTLIIMQGSSGSGKSFVAEMMKSYYDGQKIECQICSTDNYWYIEDGVTYKFDPSKLGVAHKWNQDWCQDMMKTGVQVIIIDNTNTTQTEADPYLKMAQQFGYEPRVVSVDCPLSVAQKYNSQRPIDRRIPTAVMEKQRNRMKRIILEG